jgi:hypothetical protein
MSIRLVEVENPILRDGKVPENAYILMLPQIDRLMGFLARAASVSLEAFLSSQRPDRVAIEHYRDILGTEFGRTPAPEGRP